LQRLDISQPLSNDARGQKYQSAISVRLERYNLGTDTTLPEYEKPYSGHSLFWVKESVTGF